MVGIYMKKKLIYDVVLFICFLIISAFIQLVISRYLLNNLNLSVSQTSTIIVFSYICVLLGMLMIGVLDWIKKKF